MTLTYSTNFELTPNWIEIPTFYQVYNEWENKVLVQL